MKLIDELIDHLMNIDDFPEEYIRAIEEFVEQRPKPIKNTVPAPKEKLSASEIEECKNGKLFEQTVIDDEGEPHVFYYNPMSKKWVKSESPTGKLLRHLLQL